LKAELSSGVGLNGNRQNVARHHTHQPIKPFVIFDLAKRFASVFSSIGSNRQGEQMSSGKPELVNPQPEKLPPSLQAGIDPASRAGPWMDERKRSYASLLLLTAGALYMAFIVYRPFLKALFLAMVLTIAFLPIHDLVARRFRGNTVAALITTTIVLLVIMLPLMFITIRLVSEAASLYGFLSQQGGAAWSNRSALLTEAIDRAAEQTGMPSAQIRSAITSRVQEMGSWLVSMVGWAARGLAQQLTTGILTLLVLFFFLRDREKYSRTIVSTFPLPPGRVQELSGALHDTVVSNLYGMVAVGLIQGSLTALGCGWLACPHHSYGAPWRRFSHSFRF